jgi:hypothetical protein
MQCTKQKPEQEAKCGICTPKLLSKIHQPASFEQASIAVPVIGLD